MKNTVKIVQSLKGTWPIIAFVAVLSSCGLNEISNIEKVSVKSSAKIVVPLAYGDIDTKTLFNYLGAGSDDITPDNNGYHSFDTISGNFSYPDTFAFNGSFFDNMQLLELRIETENKLPLGLQLELYFTDSTTFNLIDPPVTCNFLQPASVDDNGLVVTPSHNVENVELSKDQMEKYKLANSLIVTASFSLPETENDKIYIHENDFISLNVGMIVQLNSVN